MEKYIHLTVASDSDVFTVGQFLRSQGHLTKKQISRAKFYPDGIQKKLCPMPHHGTCTCR